MPTNYVNFNELSLPPATLASAEISRLLLDFSTTFNIAWKMGLRFIRTRSDFHQISSKEGDSIRDIINNLPNPHRGALFRALDTPHIKEDQGENADAFIDTDIIAIENIACNDAEGLLSAHLNKTLAISLQSSDTWNRPFISIKIRSVRTKAEQTVKLPHISNRTHLVTHTVAIGELTYDRHNTPPSKSTPLPNSLFTTTFFANNDWSKIMRSCFEKPIEERSTQIRELATKIARMNGYNYEPSLSSLNQKKKNSLRQIFSSGYGKERIYLSTDFEKGAFEVCDYRGCHLGEWLFYGKKQNDEDADGHHNIILE